MSLPDRLADGVATYSSIVLVVLLLATALIGAGMPMVDDDSSLDQFESDSPEAKALEYANENFTSDEQENTTTVQVIVRGNGDDVLTKESLVASLEFQQEIRNDPAINETLVEDQPIVGVENLVARTAIQQERGAELERRSAELNATADRLEAGLNETVGIERRYAELNASYENGEVSDAEYERRSAALEDEFDRVFREATTDLDDEQSSQYADAMSNLRSIESNLFRLERAYEAGEISEAEYQEQRADLEERRRNVYLQGTQGVLQDEFEQLEADAEELRNPDAEPPSLDEQIEQLESMNESEFEETLTTVLDDEGGEGGPGGDFALRLMASSYDPGSTSADARMFFVTQSTESAAFQGPGGVDAGIQDAQLRLQELAQQQDEGMVVYGYGIISDEIDRSMTDSLAIVSPLALLFVVLALLIAYRDPLDIVLGVAGVGVVLVWTFGFMGWADIAFNQMFVAIPVLLIGLSIDYAIHVFMRHREQREAHSASEKRVARDAERPSDHASGPLAREQMGSEATREQRATEEVPGDVRGSMQIALAGVGVALIWVTATTIIGFLSNLVSPIGPIREFGVVSSFGIFAALIVFGAMVPAAKVMVDEYLENRGFDRRKRAFGTGGGAFSGILSIGAVAARKAPLVVLVLVLVVTAGGVYGATQVDTSFEQEDFLADSPPEWTQNLPESMQPGEYNSKAHLEYINENFQRQDSRAQLLVRDDVTDDRTLERVAAIEDEAAEKEITYVLASGEADVRSPLAAMEETAERNETFNESFTAADTDGNGVPDQNLESLYDEFYEADAEAAQNVLYRTEDGEYEALRMIVSIKGDASTADTTTEMRALADEFEDGGAQWDVVATGDPIVEHIVEQDLLDTVLESLLISLVAVFGFLSIAYWITGNSASLGAVTLIPVALSVSWILGTMYLIGMPFNVLTGMITSLTIGLGVAYSIHISSRYTLELERQGSVWDAMNTTVTGTGGALLGSAATTVGGFGVLAFAILPVLTQFGIITALTIVYAFLASVIVLPTLLVLWTRYFGPDVAFDSPTAPAPEGTASDGGVTVADDDRPVDSDDGRGGER